MRTLDIGTAELRALRKIAVAACEDKAAKLTAAEKVRVAAWLARVGLAD